MESLIMKYKIIVASIFVFSCASSSTTSKTPSQDMDLKEIDQTASNVQEDPEKSTSTTARNSVDATAKDNSPTDGAYNWKRFFKGPPSSKERPALQQSIRQLSSAANLNQLMQRARNEFALGLFGAAESSFRQALRKDPKNFDALVELAATLQKSRKISKSFDVLAEARNNLAAQERPDPNAIFCYRYTLALTYLANDEKQKAHSILSDLIGKDKTFLPGYAALAFSYLKDGKDSVAKFIVEQAMDRGGDHPSLYNISGILSERQGKLSAAKEFYNKALAMNDSFAPALVNRANIYMQSREIQMAETDYKKALDSDPANIEAMIGLGATLRQSGRHKAAKDLFERVIEIDSDNPQARFNLAVLMRENMKDDGTALRYFNEVTQSERANTSLKASARAAIDEIRTL
jgi:tetratricopeptide (TPR) repeat protein